MVVQKKRPSGPLPDYGRGAFSGYAEFRHGEKRKPYLSKSPARRIVEAQKRDATIARTAERLKQGKASKFQFEGPIRHELRRAWVLQGHRWALADLEAEKIVSAALAQIGAVRPTWAHGQRYVTTGPDICLWCYGPLDDEDKLKHRRFCSPECARAAQVHFDWESNYNASEIGWHAGYILRLARHETKRCVVCDKAFRTTRAHTFVCSQACRVKWQSAQLQPRQCVRCGTEFQPMNDQAKFCSSRCLHLEKEDRKARRKRKLMAAQPDRKCAHCGKSFHPKRISKDHHQYCGDTCQRLAARARAHPPKPPRNCLWCGKEFQPPRSDSTCCSVECRNHYHNRKPRAGP